jgi:hypothetical protein
MKFKTEYAVGLLLLVLFTGALLNLGSYREHLTFRQMEIPALRRGKCPEGCYPSSYIGPDGKVIERCSKTNGTGNCPVLDKCPPGDVEADGICLYCPPRLKLVAGKCVPSDPNDSLPEMAPASCPAGCTFYNGGCLKEDVIYCRDPQRQNEPKCVSINYRPLADDFCPYVPCPDGSQEFNGLCRKCPVGKKLDEGLCVVDRTVPASDSNDTDDTVPESKSKKTDNTKYIILGVIAVIVIGGIMLVTLSHPAGGRRRAR